MRIIPALTVAVVLAGAPAFGQYGREDVPQPPESYPQPGVGPEHERPVGDPTQGAAPGEGEERRGTSSQGSGTFATEPETGSPEARPPGAETDR